MEWINVEDRLPEDDDDKYFIFTDGSIIHFGRYYFDNSHEKSSRFHSELGYVTDKEITHWMPLPEPPKQ